MCNKYEPGATSTKIDTRAEPVDDTPAVVEHCTLELAVPAKKNQCDPRTWPFAAAVLCVFADYVGLSVLGPALPFYLADVGLDDDAVVMWTGAIFSAQFAAVVIGNLAWGFFGDRLGSKRALQLAMVGDVVTFAITPFVRDPALLLVVRVFAGLSTPLVTSLLYIFERAKSPADTIKGMGHYTLAVIGAYMVGSALVSSLIDSVGFRGVTLITAGIALFALTWTTFLSAPSSVTERQKPSGVRYALGSRGFRVHGMVSFAVGASLNGVMLLPTWLMFDHFKFSAQQVGYPYIGIPCVQIAAQFAVRRVVARIGTNATISIGTLMAMVSIGALAVPQVHENLIAMLCATVFAVTSCILIMLPNQANARLIANAYATNAVGAVTGMGRTCFALGQGVSPVAFAALYNWHPSGAFVGWWCMHAAQLGLRLYLQQPLWHDVELKPADGSPAAKLKEAVAAGQVITSTPVPSPEVGSRSFARQASTFAKATDAGSG